MRVKQQSVTIEEVAEAAAVYGFKQDDLERVTSNIFYDKRHEYVVIGFRQTTTTKRVDCYFCNVYSIQINTRYFDDMASKVWVDNNIMGQLYDSLLKLKIECPFIHEYRSRLKEDDRT